MVLGLVEWWSWYGMVQRTRFAFYGKQENGKELCSKLVVIATAIRTC